MELSEQAPDVGAVCKC